MKRKGVVGALFGRIEVPTFAYIKKTKHNNLVYKRISFLTIGGNNLKKIKNLRTNLIWEPAEDFQDANLIIVNNYLKTMNVE